jgi:hypothetical protein
VSKMTDAIIPSGFGSKSEEFADVDALEKL